MNKSFRELVKGLLEVSKDLTLLYVEDEIKLQDSMLNIFNRYFKDVDSALNGLEALDLCKKRDYDLIITDINMPIMNGIDFVKKIKSKNYDQKIIIISAHNETEYMYELINLGVDGFLTKPTDSEQLLRTLLKVTSQLNDCKLLNSFQEKLEESYIELMNKNEALERANRKITYQENRTIALANSNKNTISEEYANLLSKHFKEMSAIEFYETYPTDLDNKNEILEKLEDRIDVSISNLNSKKDLESLSDVISIFRDYGTTIDSINEFSNLGYAIYHLAEVLSKQELNKFNSNIIELLFSISKALEDWRIVILEKKSADNIHYLDNSLINDSIMIEAMLKDTQIESEDDVTFF